jgi:hypothetical protein
MAKTHVSRIIFAAISVMASVAGASEPSSFIARVEQSQDTPSGAKPERAAAPGETGRTTAGEPASFIARVELTQLAFAFSEEQSISDDASFDAALAGRRASFADEVWSTPCLTQPAPAAARARDDGPAAAGQADVGPVSGDALISRIVAQYRRAELDRGGWTNPYAPSAAAGNPLLSVNVAGGVTSPRAAADLPECPVAGALNPASR